MAGHLWVTIADLRPLWADRRGPSPQGFGDPAGGPSLRREAPHADGGAERGAKQPSIHLKKYNTFANMGVRQDG